MREDTKDLVAVTVLIFFGVAISLFMLWADATYFLAIVAILGSISLFSWALIRVCALDK